jgi:hypothetical protein
MLQRVSTVVWRVTEDTIIFEFLTVNKYIKYITSDQAFPRWVTYQSFENLLSIHNRELLDSMMLFRKTTPKPLFVTQSWLGRLPVKVSMQVTMSEWWNSIFDRGVWNFLVTTPLISYRLSGNSQSHRTGSEFRSKEYPADRRSAKLTSRLLLVLMQEALASCPTHTFRARY